MRLDSGPPCRMHRTPSNPPSRLFISQSASPLTEAVGQRGEQAVTILPGFFLVHKNKCIVLRLIDLLARLLRAGHLKRNQITMGLVQASALNRFNPQYLFKFRFWHKRALEANHAAAVFPEQVAVAEKIFTAFLVQDDFGIAFTIDLEANPRGQIRLE
jgi:hypothetical protein